MPNIASVMKDEIVRLAKKEVRKVAEGLKKASVQYRSDIAALKRQVAVLERQVARLEKNEPKKAAIEVEGGASTKFRFSARRFSAQRQKSGLSAGDMGTLIGVSAQTIYNWEAEKSRPRVSQMAAIAAVRKLGKKAIQAQLANQVK